MTEYKPGTVAKIAHADNRGDHFLAIRGGDGWFSAAFGFTRDLFVGDVRPLVVLDLDSLDPHVAPKVGNVLRVAGDNTFADDSPQLAALKAIADQIEEQTPRIPEPGKYGIVKAVDPSNGQTDAEEWVSEGKFWVSLDGGTRATWNELIDPVLVREGV